MFDGRAQTAAQVADIWERLHRYRLSEADRARFIAEERAVALAGLPRRSLESAGREVLAATGVLRFSAWAEAAVLHQAAFPPLLLELVPETCWWSNLRSELSAKDWDRCKRWTSERADRCCEICGGRGPRWPVECHERWVYEETPSGAPGADSWAEVTRVQRLEGLIALCPACHKATHMGFAHTQGWGEQALNHLARVNGWTVHAARDHFHDAGDQWLERSQYEWGLDVSWLPETLGIAVDAHRPPAVSDGYTDGGLTIKPVVMWL